MLITIYSGKHNLIFIWKVFLNDIGSFLKDWVQHLTKATPVGRENTFQHKDQLLKTSYLKIAISMYPDAKPYTVYMVYM